MNWKTIATTTLFSCALVACSKQDDRKTIVAHAKAQAKLCTRIKDINERNKCVHDACNRIDVNEDEAMTMTIGDLDKLDEEIKDCVRRNYIKVEASPTTSTPLKNWH